MEGSHEKNEEATEGRGSMVKCGETPFNRGQGACEYPVGLSMYDGPMETVEYSWVNGACLIGFCHKTAEIHSLREGKKCDAVLSTQTEDLTQTRWTDIRL